VLFLFWTKKKPEAAQLPTPTLEPFGQTEPVVHEDLFPNLVLPDASAMSGTLQNQASLPSQPGIISPPPADPDQPFITARTQDAAQASDVWDRNPPTTPIPLVQYAMPSLPSKPSSQPAPTVAAAVAMAAMPARMNVPVAASGQTSAPASPAIERCLPPLFTPEQLQEAQGPLFTPQQLKQAQGSLGYGVWREEAKQQARDLSFVEAHKYLDLLSGAGAIRQLLDVLQKESGEAVETEEKRDASYARMLSALGAMEEQFLSVEHALSQR
jgi:hypothetical protein